MIYKEHLNVLNAGRLSRDQAKSNYLRKCLDQIKSQPGLNLNSMYALKHVYDILSTYKNKSWSTSKSLKDVLSDIVVPEIKSICQSLLNYNTKRDLHIQTIFTHEQAIDMHLNLIKFILKEGNLYLKLVRAEEIWDSLNCDFLSKQKCYEWFVECILDLNEQTRADIFKQRVFKLDSTQLTLKAYECFRLYFLYLYQSESKIQITTSDASRFLVEDSDLDLGYLW